MKKHLLLMGFGLFFGVAVWLVLFHFRSDNGPSVYNGVEFVDFGLGSMGSLIDVRIPVSNSGSGDLVLSNFQGSCACTQVPRKDLVLREGERADIVLKLSLRRIGRFTEYLAFKTNDLNRSRVSVSIRGSVDQIFATIPDRLVLMSEDDGSVGSKYVSILPIGSQSSLSTVAVSGKLPPFINAKVVESGSSKAIIKVDIGKYIPSGEIEAAIEGTVAVDGIVYPLHIPVVGVIEEAIKSDPPALLFGPKTGTTTKTVTFTDIGTDAKLDAQVYGGVATSVQVLMHNNTLMVSLNERASFDVFESGMVLISEKQSGKHLISVPIYFGSVRYK